MKEYLYEIFTAQNPDSVIDHGVVTANSFENAAKKVANQDVYLLGIDGEGEPLEMHQFRFASDHNMRLDVFENADIRITKAGLDAIAEAMENGDF